MMLFSTLPETPSTISTLVFSMLMPPRPSTLLKARSLSSRTSTTSAPTSPELPRKNSSPSSELSSSPSSTNSPTRPPPRSSVVTSSSTTFSSPPSPTPSSPTSPRPPRSSRASFSSSLSTAMLRTTSESWNSSASLMRTAHPCESSTWRRIWPSMPQNPTTSPPPLSRPSSRLSSERTSTTSSSTPPRTSSSSSTPHGADTANPLPQSGTSSVRSTRITLTSSSPSLTPPLTNSK